MKPEIYNTVSDTLYRIISKFREIEKIPRSFGIEKKLYPSEIHMIQAIGRDPGINVTGLAQHLGVTKGAVPKILRKLESKGLVVRYRDDSNNKEVYFTLTAEGEKAYRGHEAFHATLDAQMVQMFSKFNENEIDLILAVLGELDSLADRALHGT